MKIFALMSFLLVLQSCSTQEDLVLKDCVQEREITNTIEAVRGTIVKSLNSCPSEDFKILPSQSSEGIDILIPCNLPETFKREGLEIIFSGRLYETNQLEDVCAFPFELTKINKS